MSTNYFILKYWLFWAIHMLLETKSQQFLKLKGQEHEILKTSHIQI